MNLTASTTWLGAVMVLILVPLAQGARERTVYTFGAPGSGDGMYPYCTLVADAQGNLYGTTSQGGTYNAGIVFDKLGNLYGTTYEGGKAGCFQGCGTVFELSPVQGGGWKEQVLHAFAEGGTDGVLPSGVAVTSNGVVYGTTQNGGTAGSGVLYQLEYSPAQNTWIETIVHQFVGGNTDGAFPESALLIHA